MNYNITVEKAINDLNKIATTVNAGGFTFNYGDGIDTADHIIDLIQSSIKYKNDFSVKEAYGRGYKDCAEKYETNGGKQDAIEEELQREYNEGYKKGREDALIEMSNSLDRSYKEGYMRGIGVGYDAGTEYKQRKV